MKRFNLSESKMSKNKNMYHETGVLPNDSGSWDPNKYMSLYKAAQKGDWQFAKELFQDDPNAMTAKITKFSETALHVAATAGHSKFVEELVKIMPLGALKFKETKDGETVLHLAAISGITEAAKAIVKLNPQLTQMCNYKGWVPLLSAASYVSSSSKERQKQMVEYLYTFTRDGDPSLFKGALGATLLCTLIKTGFYDIGLSLVERYPDLAIETDNNGVCALEVLAEQPEAFGSGTHLTVIEHLMYKFIQVDLQRHYVIKGDAENPPEIPADYNISKGVIAKLTIVISMTLGRSPRKLQGYYKILKAKQALALVKCILARISQMPNSDISDFFRKTDIVRKFTRSGISEFIVECLQTFPFETNKQEILKIAVEQRNGNIFRLIYELNVDQKLLSFQDESGNTILHLAAKLAPHSVLSRVIGEVFQMQQEMHWFKAVENIVHDTDKSKRNKDGKTAYELFTEEHNDLMQKAEKWAKGTAKSSMLVASLVATVVFAAAITVPGGNISDSNNIKNNGTPIFLQKNSFLIFAVADALAFFSSITSAMMFITVLISRYNEVDYLVSLPRKIILNLLALIFSISTMLITFGAAFSILLENGFSGAPISIALMSVVPVTLFNVLALPSLQQMVIITYVPQQLVQPTRKKKNSLEPTNVLALPSSSPFSLTQQV